MNLGRMLTADLWTQDFIELKHSGLPWTSDFHRPAAEGRVVTTARFFPGERYRSLVESPRLGRPYNLASMSWPREHENSKAANANASHTRDDRVLQHSGAAGRQRRHEPSRPAQLQGRVQRR